MRTYINVFLLIFVVILVAASCGKSDLNYSGQRPADVRPVPNDQPIDAVNLLGDRDVVRGFLTMDEDSIARYAVVNYAIYKTGIIAYEGVVSFRGFFNGEPRTVRGFRYVLSDLGDLFTETFKGSIRVAPETVQSSTYKEVNAYRPEGEVQFKVIDQVDNIRTVAASFINSKEHAYTIFDSTDHEATGTLTIDVSGKLIDITEARIQGRVFSSQRSITVRKVRPL